MRKTFDQELEEMMFDDLRPSSRYILYAYSENGCYGIVKSWDNLQILVNDAQMLRAFHRKNGTEWGDWYEIVERATGKTVFSSRTALQTLVMCPFCLDWEDTHYPISDDFFGSACEIDGVRCCEVCYTVYWINKRGEENG